MPPLRFASILALCGPFLAVAADLAAVRAELEAMRDTDQAQRKLMTATEREHGANSPQMQELWKKQNVADAHNIRRLEAIIAEHGWPGRSAVGEEAAGGAFLILQHADISYQKKYLEIARAAAKAGEMNAARLALLEDRILMREGKRQIYGSQVSRNAAGDWEAFPIEDEAHVDERRAAVGLPPLAGYLQGFADRGGGKVADRSGERAIENAPALTQSLFGPADDAPTALEKLEAFTPARGESAVQLQWACRDFCARFPRSSRYGAVRVLAARCYALLGAPELARLGDWDPAAGELDQRLTAEERAEIALTIVQVKAERAGFGVGKDQEDARLDALAIALAPHRRTEAARDGLIAAAFEATPAKAILTLRETYADDPVVARAVAALKTIGKPCELQFTALDGRAFDLQALRGKVVLISFWPRDPAVVRSGVATMKALERDLGDANLAVVATYLQNDRAVAEAWVKENAIAWPVFHDGLGWKSALAERFFVNIAPYYLLIDRKGVLRFRGIGPASDTAQRRTRALVGEQAEQP